MIIIATFRRFLPALALTVTAAACGGASEPPSSTAATESTTARAPVAQPAAEAATPVVHDGRAIEITADDTMKFSVAEIRATAGERLSLTLANVGTMPKLSMGHNVVLLTADADPDAFVTAAASAPTTEYVPAARRTEVIAATNLLGPNERATVTFDAPTSPGAYVFLCSFPGHFQVGMRGVLIVE